MSSPVTVDLGAVPPYQRYARLRAAGDAEGLAAYMASECASLAEIEGYEGVARGRATPGQLREARVRAEAVAARAAEKPVIGGGAPAPGEDCRLVCVGACGSYALRTLPSVARVVGSAALVLEATFVARGGVSAELLERHRQALQGLRECPGLSPRQRTFGALELARRLALYLLAADDAALLAAHLPPLGVPRLMEEAAGALRAAAALVQRAADRQQSAALAGDDYAACAELTRELALFFHLALSYAEGLCGGCGALARGLSLAGGAVFGAERFPLLREWLETPLRAGGDAAAALDTRAVAAVVTQALAPAGEFAALLALSALAALPLAEALACVTASLPEWRAMLSACPPAARLLALLAAGSFEGVLQLAKTTADAHLPRAAPSAALAARVRRALCAQYLGMFDAVPLSAAAAGLGVGERQLAAAAERLLLAGSLPPGSRIDRVHRILCVGPADGARGQASPGRDGAAARVIEMQTRLLVSSAESLMLPTSLLA